MEKKNLNEFDRISNFKWCVLGEKMIGNEIIESKIKEKIFVKEGICEECGGFDVLSRFDDKFICNACIGLMGAIKAKKIRTRKKKK